MGIGNYIGGKIANQVDEADVDGFINKIVAALTKKGMEFKKSALKSIIRKLSPSTEVEPLERVFMPEGKDTYLSKSMTAALVKKLKEWDKQLREVPNSILSDYRDESLLLIKNLLIELEDYDKCFDIFMFGKTSRFSSKKSLSYNNILAARKAMKTCLSNMSSLLKKYNEGDKYKFEKFKDKLEQKSSENRDTIKAARAHAIFEDAYSLVHDYIMEHEEVKGSTGVYSSKEMTKDKLLKTYENNKDLSRRLAKALELTSGVKSYKEDNSPEKPDVYTGYKRCLHEAERQLEEIDRNNPFALTGVKATSDFMGDHTPDIETCVNYTKNQLNTVINLGAKKDTLYDVNFSSKEFGDGSLGINLEILLGDEYKENEKKWERQNKNVDSSLKGKNLSKLRDSMRSKIEKAYKSVQKHQEKYLRNGLPEPKETEHRNFKNLTVSLKPTKEERGTKNYNITEKYAELKKYYNGALDSVGKDDYNLLYIRKAERFWDACNKWNQFRPEYEKWIKGIYADAKSAMRLAKEHYNKLRKDKRITKEQVKTLTEKYNALPKSASDFVKNYNENLKKKNEFCSLELVQVEEGKYELQGGKTESK